MTQSPAPYDYDVAVSFAGEDRPFVAKVVELLKGADVKVFYDRDEQAAMWGENLVDFLDGVYQHRARFAIVFVSRNYVDKAWPNHERQSAQARALIERSTYLLPVRLDDSSLPGLRPTISYLDGLAVGAQGVVDTFKKKLQTALQQGETSGDLRAVPTTDEGIQRLVDEQPDFWEHILYGAIVRRGIAALAEKRRDHDLGLAAPSGRYVLDGDAFTVVRQAMNDIQAIGGRFNKVLAPEVTDAAFGAPGQPGDPDRISHAARRLTDVYRDLLDWAAGLRGISTPESEAREVFEALARYADQPLQALEAMSVKYVAALDGFLVSDDPDLKLRLTLTVTWEIPEEATQRYDAAMNVYKDKHL